MRKSFWKNLIRSFNPKFFKEIAPQSLKESFKYLAFLLLLLALVLSFKSTINFTQGIQRLSKGLPDFFEELKDFPEITIQNGELILPKEFYTKEWERGGIIIDPEGEIGKYLEILPTKFSVILLKDKIIIPQMTIQSKTEKRVGETSVYDLSQIKYFNLRIREGEKLLKLAFDNQKFDLTAKKANKWANTLSLIFFPIATIFIFIFLLIGKLIQVFGFSLISLIINKVKKVGLNYQNLLNIGIFSLTLPLILGTVVKLSGISIPYFGLFNSGLYIAFLVIGILNAKTIVVQPFSK